jgi:hypothetical protein
MKIYDLISDNRDLFSDDFVDWLPENMHIFQAFVVEAAKINSRGFKHYSARTIIHVLRHHSAITEINGEWKINNNYSPYLARLFDLAYPHMAGMFEYRTAYKAEKDAMNRWGKENEQARI